MLTRLLVCASMAGGRLIELAWSRRNVAAAGPSREGPWSRRTFPAMVALHGAVLGMVAVKGGRPRALPLAMLLAVQPLRAWVLLTLGERWNARGSVADELEVATTGPYRWVRHPNYTVVAIELAALPLAFRMWRLAIVASAVNAALLAVRIREEEAMLRERPGYDVHFRRLARFIPGLF